MKSFKTLAALSFVFAAVASIPAQAAKGFTPLQKVSGQCRGCSIETDGHSLVRLVQMQDIKGTCRGCSSDIDRRLA